MFNLDSEQLVYKIAHFIPYILGFYKSSGVIYEPMDERNFKTSQLGWSLFGYTPKSQSKIIEPFMVLNQGVNNCCVFCATTSHKMDQDKIELDVSDIISYARRKGLTSGNGFASIDAGFKVLKEYGISEGKNPEVLGDWETLSSHPINTPEASKHKISSYWEVNRRDDALKLLDDGNTLPVAFTWMTGFNRSGGFSAPWLITKDLGYSVGGHDTKICGYLFLDITPSEMDGLKSGIINWNDLYKKYGIQH